MDQPIVTRRDFLRSVGAAGTLVIAGSHDDLGDPVGL